MIEQPFVLWFDIKHSNRKDKYSGNTIQLPLQNFYIVHYMTLTIKELPLLHVAIKNINPFILFTISSETSPAI
jgi:hypothetical protein